MGEYIGQHHGQQKAHRISTLGGQIGQIDAQQLARDRGWRIIGEKMDARYQRIHRDNQFTSRGRRQKGRIITQTKPRWTGNRSKQTGNQRIFRQTPLCDLMCRHACIPLKSLI